MPASQGLIGAYNVGLLLLNGHLLRYHEEAPTQVAQDCLAGQSVEGGVTASRMLVPCMLGSPEVLVVYLADLIICLTSLVAVLVRCDHKRSMNAEGERQAGSSW